LKDAHLRDKERFAFFKRRRLQKSSNAWTRRECVQEPEHAANGPFEHAQSTVDASSLLDSPVYKFDDALKALTDPSARGATGFRDPADANALEGRDDRAVVKWWNQG
jgi:hypothetical protein